MACHLRRLVWPAILCFTLSICRAQAVPQEWSESQVIERFLALSPQARELRARVALTEAEARARQPRHDDDGQGREPQRDVVAVREAIGANGANGHAGMRS